MDYIEYFDSVADGYEAVLSKARMKVFEAQVSSILKLHLPQKEALILDLGGKSGRWTAAMGKLGHRVMLVEASSRLLDIAKSRIEAMDLHKSVVPIWAEYEKLKFEDNTFDFILCLDVMGYFDAKTVLSEIVRTLRPSGAAVVGFPGRVGLARELASSGKIKEGIDLLETSYLDEPIRAKAYTLGEATKLCEDAKLSKLASYGLNLLSSSLENEVEADELEKLTELDKKLAANAGLAEAAPTMVLVLTKPPA